MPRINLLPWREQSGPSGETQEGFSSVLVVALLAGCRSWAAKLTVNG
jgi:Tfp pilus assembly protein PilN